MTLRELEPEFVRHETRDGRHYNIDVATIAEAQSVQFLCPVCYQKNQGPVGTHGVMVTFANRGVPDHLGSQSRNGGPSRWTASGTGLDDLTLTPSIDLTPGCTWHGFITGGQVT